MTRKKGGETGARKSGVFFIPTWIDTDLSHQRFLRRALLNVLVILYADYTRVLIETIVLVKLRC